MQLSKGWRYDMVTEGEWEGRGFLSALHTRKGNDLSPLAEIYVILGGAYWRVGASDEAIQSFEKAIEISPKYAEAYLLKGLLHRERGESDDAHEDIYWAISLNPDFYIEIFEPIMQAERESEALWDDLRSQPEFDAMLQNLEKDL